MIEAHYYLLLILAGKLQERINKFWRENKHDTALICAEITRLRNRASELRDKSALWTWVKESSKKSPQAQSEIIIVEESKSTTCRKDAAPRGSHSREIPQSIEEGIEGESSDARSKPAQEKLKGQINAESLNIARLSALKESGLATPEEKSQLAKAAKSLKKLESSLKRKQQLASYSQNVREKRKRNIEELKAMYPEMTQEIANKSGTRPSAGRPRIEESFPTLLQTIVDIVAPEASADERRRSELLRSCTSLDDLKKELERRIEGKTGAGA